MFQLRRFGLSRSGMCCSVKPVIRQRNSSGLAKLARRLKLWQMVIDYIREALKLAEYEQMENGRYFATIPGLKGLWGEEATLEACRTELESTLEDWIALRLRFGDRLPVIGGINLHAAADEDDAKWLKQMEEDAASGKLDFLFEEADRAEKAGDLLDWPANE